MDAVILLETLIELVKPLVGKYCALNNNQRAGSSDLWKYMCNKTSLISSLKNKQPIRWDYLSSYVYDLLLRNAVIGFTSGMYAEQCYLAIFDDLWMLISNIIYKLMPDKITDLENRRQISDREQIHGGLNPTGRVKYMNVYNPYIGQQTIHINNRQDFIHMLIDLETKYGSDKNIIEDLEKINKDLIKDLIKDCLEMKIKNIGFVEKYMEFYVISVQYNIKFKEYKKIKHDKNVMYEVKIKLHNSLKLLYSKIKNMPKLYNYYEPEIKRLYKEQVKHIENAIDNSLKSSKYNSIDLGLL